MNNENWYSPLNSSENTSAPSEESAAAEPVYDENADVFDMIAEETGASGASSDSREEQPEYSSVKKKRKGGFWKVLLLIILILAVAAASIFVFGNIRLGRFGSDIKVIVGNGEDEKTYTHSSSDGDIFDWVPEDDTEKDKSDDDDDDIASGILPDDFNDFFSGYYTAVEEAVTADVKLDRTELPIDFEMELEDPGTAELSLQELYAECSDSVVAIIGYTDDMKGRSWGTGIILSSDGLIVTNTHVIDECSTAVVTLSTDEEYNALLVGFDTTSDIAVLKIDAEDLPAAEFARSDTLVVGDSVVAIGNPLGESFRFTLTNGIISGIDRGVSYNGRTMTVLQTNTALNSGNSGGPLFNMYGQVIGITNMKMMSSYSSIEGIGFAIPTKSVVQIVNSLVENGEFRGRTSVGMTVGAVPENASAYYSLPKGLYVTDVVKNSGADKAGITKGDIITEVNGIEVRNTSEVLAIINDFAVGDFVPMTLWRDGKLYDIKVELMDYNDIYG